MLTLLPLANSAPAEAVLLGVANTFTVDDEGWALIPYGDSLHNGANAERANSLEEVRGKPGVIQRLTRENAQRMAEAFHSLRGRIKRAVIGYNVYRGHPDCAAFANMFRDKTPRGTIADMEAADAGLRLKIVLNDQGATDVEGGLTEYSPFWYGREAGEEQGRKVYEPVIFKSVGLVPKGNIPGLSLVNADPASLSAMKNQLIELLALLGITVPAETAETPEAFAPFVDQAKAALGGMKPKADMEAEIAAANAKVTEAATALANAKTEGENTARALRTSAATAVVTAAIAAGRLPAAERETHVVALVNAADFAAAALGLANKAPTLPTASRLGELSQTGKDQQSRQQNLLGLVNAQMETEAIKALPAHQRYDAAYKAATESAAGKAILAAMHTPGTAK